MDVENERARRGVERGEVEIIQSILNGDRLALSRLLTQVENDSPAGRDALTELFPHTGKAHLIGVTGASGVGKSSLVNQLARHYRQTTKQRVAIIAVDPSSPFTGGAVLGDRVRMRDLAGDAGVFIRSMATRGSLGGLAQSTVHIAQVFDAAGFDIVIIETVGAGQSEVDVARLAHTTLVVEAPGMGDDIQAAKAGILEIADILVVNKADRLGAENTERALKSMLELAPPSAWIPPVLRTVSTEGKGVAELAESIAAHWAHLNQSGGRIQRERARLESELDALIRAELMNRFRESVSQNQYDDALEKILQRAVSPLEAIRILMRNAE